METEKILSNIYYDVQHPASFSSANKLYLAAKQFIPNLKIKNVQDWLQSQITYTLHKNARKNFARNKIIVKHIDEQWQIDLVDMQEFARQNQGYKYLMTVIDCLSKYAFVQPIKNKTNKDVISAFQKILKGGRKCFYLQSDQGKEFVGNPFQNFLKEQEIHHFTSNKNSTIKCAIVERFNRTLKEKMFKYFTAKGTRKYIDKLENFVKAYNNSFHRSIKMKPTSVTPETESEAFCNLYGTTNYRSLLKRHYSKLAVGDIVRKRYILGPMDKGYYPKWSDELYKVSNIIKGDIKAAYKIKTMNNSPVKGRFYIEDLQKVTENFYRIEKILKTRTRNGIKEYFVKWIGFGNEYNSWTSDIIQLNSNGRQE